MQPIYNTTIQIAPNDIDLHNRLKVSAFFTYIQTAAAVHAESLGLGYQGMRAAGIAWVLAWVRLEVGTYPQYRDALEVTTWPKKPYRLYSLRDFFFRDQTGELIGRATSAWLPVDAHTRRLTRLDRLPQPVPYQPDHIALDVLPSRLPLAGGAETGRRTIRYSDLDIMQHTNNQRYVEYLLDSCPLEFHQSHRLRTIEISFQSESRIGEELALYHQADGPRLAVTGRNAPTGAVIFQAVTEWQALSIGPISPLAPTGPDPLIC